MKTHRLSWKRVDAENWLSSCGRYHVWVQARWAEEGKRSRSEYAARGPRESALAGAVQRHLDELPSQDSSHLWLIDHTTLAGARRACQKHADQPDSKPGNKRGRRSGFKHSTETRQKMKESHRRESQEPEMEVRIVPVPSSPDPFPGPIPRSDLIRDLRRIVHVAVDMVGGTIHEPTSILSWQKWMTDVGREVEAYLSRLQKGPGARRRAREASPSVASALPAVQQTLPITHG